MPTCYEILSFQPSTRRAEIESVIEVIYNRWRHLVSHHISVVVEEASLELINIEPVHGILIDPEKRANNDMSLNIGGLTDPEAIIRVAQTTKIPQSHERPEEKNNVPMPVNNGSCIWTCPKCNTQYQSLTIYCYKCGTQLVSDCPNCKKMSVLVLIGICGFCGFKYKIAQQYINLKSNINMLYEELKVARADYTRIKNKKTSNIWCWFSGFFFLVVGISMYLIFSARLYEKIHLVSIIGLIIGSAILAINSIVTFYLTVRKNSDISNVYQWIEEREKIIIQFTSQLHCLERHKTGG